MRRSIWLFLMASAIAFAADFSGKWAGTLEARNSAVPRSDAHFVTLVQKGESVTGTAGPKRDLWQIKDARVEGSRITFSVQGGALLIGYSLALEGDELNGTAELKNREGVSWNVRLKREK